MSWAQRKWAGLLPILLAGIVLLAARLPPPPRPVDLLYLQPIGAVRESELDVLTAELRTDYRVVRLPPISAPYQAWWPSRRQYRADQVLRFLRRTAPSDGRLLAVADLDATIPEVNFVFGLADCPGRVASIYLRRLRHQATGARWRHRLITTARHELGHTAGLRHCPDETCLMHLSNTATATDRKRSTRCKRCARGPAGIRRTKQRETVR